MYKLNKGQKLLLKMAKKGMSTDIIIKEVDDVLKGRVPNPVKENYGPMKIIDDEYDGPEDRCEEICINPDKNENKILAYLIKRFGYPFGFIYFFYLDSYAMASSKRSAGQRVRYLKERIFKDVDFGEA